VQVSLKRFQNLFKRGAPRQSTVCIEHVEAPHSGTLATFCQPQ
jgi:hypothetical protein